MKPNVVAKFDNLLDLLFPRLSVIKASSAILFSVPKASSTNFITCSLSTVPLPSANFLLFINLSKESANTVSTDRL